MSKNTLQWNPEQNFGDDKIDIHVQCRKNVKLIDDILKERLKSVSLIITTLLTSLHDTTKEGMNQCFKIAIENFERITISTNKILEKFDQILGLLLSSPQGIITIAIASIISVSPMLGLILVTHIIILIKALRHEDEDNAKLIKYLCERWDIIETMVRNQVQENKLPRAVESPRAVEIPRAVEMIPVAVGDSNFFRQAATTKSLRFEG